VSKNGREAETATHELRIRIVMNVIPDRKANRLPRIEKGGRRAKARCPNIKLKIDGVQSRRKLYLLRKQDQHQKSESNSENIPTKRSVKEVGRTGGRLRTNCDHVEKKW
jgi:hypothetical protein